MKRRSDNVSGFTLIEAIVVVFVFSMIVYGVVMLVSNLLTSTNKQSSLLVGSDQARRLGTAFTNELRKADYAADGAYPVGLAGDQELVFYSNVDTTPDVERVRYFVQNATLMKGVVKPTGGVYDLASETPIAVQSNLANGSQPVFLYYAGNYDGTVDNHLVQPINVNQVKFIKLNLLVFNTGGLKNDNTYSVSAGAAIRNLKTNLGE